MTNKPKNIGTAAETAVVRCAREYGFDAADRRALKGSLDQGDILLCPTAIIEVKGGHAAETASANQIEKWMVETLTEVSHAGVEHGFLVTKVKGVSGKNAHNWKAHITLAHLQKMIGGDEDSLDPILTMRLGDLLSLVSKRLPPE